ncbi:MFS general substrate transporter [Chloropicon primus]|uniref:MFS general substrate transporter n=1 Tax=Chloropicon primus TaxID=1764295 RepID=A0A5B8MP49_9CHLO|nr:MFS general substrate transporter [Chloropicon primus]UPR01485.1 MFS general substrate transporter [Chloropicon primus]|mmetsp:Transcript_5376/g.16222  ORF Transcript_5376/g.16222 Transcript_5376/m.16222 type:complete len:510 (-) Transcript_5376:1476-3005(-)|eukprot:QDZ22269.1 MFS general substrate transporter [Chloropicon primus]
MSGGELKAVEPEEEVQRDTVRLLSGANGSSSEKYVLEDDEDEESKLDEWGLDGRYTFDHAVEHMGFGRFHWKLLMLCGVGYFAEITELVIVGFVAPAIEKDMGLSTVEYGLLGSSSFIGMAAGAVFWGYISDRFGRLISFSLTVWMTFIGGFLSAFSPNYPILFTLRFLAAFGIGGMLPVDYTIFLEFLPAKKRGSHIVLVGAVGVIPALFVSAIVAYSFSGKEDIKWRWVLGIVSIPVGIMAVLRRHVPESPRYHLAIGEVDKAQSILEKVAETNGVPLPRGKLAPLRKKGSSGESESSTSMHGKISLLFKGDILRATTPRLWLMWFLTQFSSSGMVFALPKIFDETFSVSKKRIALDLLWGVFGLIPGLTIAYFVVERSRKYSLAAYYVAAGASVFMFMLTTMGFLKNEFLAIVMSILLRGSMEGCFSLLNCTSVEAYPTLVRASGLGNAQIFDHIAGAMSPLFFSIFNDNTRLRPIAITVYAVAYLAAFVPTVTLPMDYVGLAIKD